LDGTVGINPEADGDDGLQCVVIDLPFDLLSPFPLNYPEFPDSCRMGGNV
jgi:hypothetical protein